MARILEDGPASDGALIQLIAQDCQSNRIEIEELGKRLDALQSGVNARFDSVDERMVGIFEMAEKHDKWLMRLLILGEGTGGK